MQENKKSKKERLEKLRMLLDNPSRKDLHTEDEKYLASLHKRLDSSKERVVYVHKHRMEEADEVDPLKPQVEIHQRKHEKAPVMPELKEFKPVEEEVSPDEEISDLQKGEDLFEVEKVEVKGPEFVEVKPKEVKEEEKENITPVETPSDLKEEKLPEWEPVETEKVKTKKVDEKKIEGKTIKLDEIKEEKTKPEIIEPAPVELITKSSEWEPVDTKEEIPVEEKFEIDKKILEPEVERERKINLFKDIESIDWETAILLYDNGFTSIDALKDASIKDLTKVKGIKKRMAKKIINELEKREKESLTEEKVEEGFKEIEQEPVSGEEDELPIDEEEVDLEEYFIIEEKSEEDAKKVDEEIAKHKFEDDERLEDVFKGLNSINNEIALLLFENGINSIDVLRETPIKKLTKIKGIRRKIAKEIKKELKELDERSNVEDYKTIERDVLSNELSTHDADDEWEAYDEQEISEEELKEIKAYRHGDYTLYQKKIETESGKDRIVRFFSKAEPDGSEPIELPKGFEVKVNKKTGVPYLKKKK